VADAHAAFDAGADGNVSVPPVLPPPSQCDGFDDLDVATAGMYPSTVWITRLRALLPAEALAVGDLRLIAAKGQVPVSNYHQTTSYADDVQAKQTRKSCAGAPLRHEPFAPLVLGLVSLLGAAAIFRRRR
jgi:hypothetical protein